MSDESISPSAQAEIRAATSEVDRAAMEATELRTLVGGMLGDGQIRALDDGTIRALSSVLLERMMYARQAGLSFNGARDMYAVLGYNRTLTYADYRARYLRGGLAKVLVDVYPSAVWRGGAEVYEDEDPNADTPFEQDWKMLDNRLSVWATFQRAHILAGLSTYSIILIGDGASDLSQPLMRGRGPASLAYLKPYSAESGPGGQQRDGRSRSMTAQATIATYDTDPKSPRFGKAGTYQIRQTMQSTPMPSFPSVHWTRVIHVADGLLEDEVYGTPAMEAVWNYLDDLDKVVGGGGEAYWLRANAGLHVNVDKSLGMPVPPGKTPIAGMDADARRALQEKAEELQHQLQRVMVTRGVEITQLSSSVSDFKGPSDAIITLIAGTKRIPKRILVGSEMGQLASGQDKDNWNTQVQDKRTSWAFPGLVKPLVDRLIEFGYLRPPAKPDAIYVEWPVIEDLTEDEKAGLAGKLGGVAVGGKPVFTADWIREKTFGLEPMTAKELESVAPEAPKEPVAAEGLEEELAMLERAIEDDDVATLRTLLGMK